METAQPFDTRAYRQALGKFATGVTVVTTLHDQDVHGMTANAFVSVSLEPPLVLVSVDHRANLHRILQQGVTHYGISVLAQDQEVLSNHFAGRKTEGLDLPFVTRLGVPLIAGAIAYFIVKLTDAHPAGDHTLYIGRVEHFESTEGRPLLFFSGQYRYIHGE